MKKLVLKFGGTSVGTIEKIRKVADIIKKKHDIQLRALKMTIINPFSSHFSFCGTTFYDLSRI